MKYHACALGGKTFFLYYLMVRSSTNKRGFLLCNMKEIYLRFKEKFNEKISFSKFCELRPEWCVPVGSSNGIHPVCVCTLHQNAKLITNSVPGVVDNKSLMIELVCDTENEQCMLHYCDKCPCVFGLKKHLRALLDDFDEDHTLNIRQWSQQSDYSSLVTIEISSGVHYTMNT